MKLLRLGVLLFCLALRWLRWLSPSSYRSYRETKKMEFNEEGEKLEAHILECPQRVDPTAQCECELDGVYCRCIICRTSFSKKEFDHSTTRCPECGTQMNAVLARGQVSVTAIWAELRCLAVWAESFAAAYSGQNPDMLKAVYAITAELEAQHPLHSPLTVGRELGLLPEATQALYVTGSRTGIQPILPKSRLQ